MIGFVIWIIGLILTFRAAIEIWNINAAVEKRLIAIVLIVLTSWLGHSSDRCGNQLLNDCSGRGADNGKTGCPSMDGRTSGTGEQLDS